MNPIGDVKGFILDVMRNIAIVFGVGYMGGSLVALTHVDTQTLDKMLPTDITQAPYVGSKPSFSLTGYGFPYSLYTQNPDFYQKVINWLVMSTAFTFIGIRKLFKWIATLGAKNPEKFDFILFYFVPILLVFVVTYASQLRSVFLVVLVLFVIVIGEYVLYENKMKNGLWMFLAPLSFWYNSFSAPLTPGLMNLIIRIFVSFLAGTLGFFAMTLFYPFWWSSTIFFALFYYTVFLFFSPFWNGTKGFKNVITELGNHRISLTVLFMLLTLWSSQVNLVPLATGGIAVGSLYMLYLLIKNKPKK